MTQEPQLSTWNAINSIIAGIIPTDKVVDNTKLDEILDLYKDNCDKWFGYFGSTFIKPRDAKGKKYGQLHFDNITFSDDFSVARVSEHFEGLKSISFSNCTFNQQLLYNKGVSITFMDKFHLKGGIESNIFKLHEKIDSQSNSIGGNIVFNEATDLNDIQLGNTPQTKLPIHNFLNNFTVIKFKNVNLDRLDIIKQTHKTIEVEESSFKTIYIDNDFGHTLKNFTASQSNITMLIIKNLGTKHRESNSEINADMRENFIIKNNCIINVFTCENLDFKHEFFISNSTFKETVTLDKNNFKGTFYCKNVQFEEAPSFLESTFSNNTLFEDCQFNDTASNKSVINYRYLKNKTHEIGDEYQSSIFQALEFESRFNTVLKNKSYRDPEYGVERISSSILKFIHNYGQDLWRPFKLLGYLSVISFSLYFFLGFTFDEGISCSGIINSDKLNYFDNTWVLTTCNNSFTASLTYALGYALGPIGLIVKNGILTPANNFIKLIEVIQFTLSSLLWFFIITSIRRRFKV